jgi:tRNA (mo5U34)-methyltransferase
VEVVVGGADSLSPDEARRLIAEVPHWHHAFEIVPGVRTPGSYDPMVIWRQLQLEQRLDGLTALDIGASDGYFTKKLVELGATVTAIDYRPKTASGFWLMERAIGREIEFHNISVYDIDPGRLGRFDIVLLLGVIYHLPDIPRMLYLARQLTKERLFVESYVEELGSGEPLARYLPRDSLAGDATNFWAPNVACLTEMLRDADFEVMRVETWGDRALAAATPVAERSRSYKLARAYGVLRRN